MSLYATPVTGTDLDQLYTGITGLPVTPTQTAQDVSEAALINAVSPGMPGPTVYSNAQQLLASNLSGSQVAMAVDSLMFGVTDSAAELNSLATNFLPAQVAYAGTLGVDPTVYAAQALGLTLSTGNGSGSNNFATTYGGLSQASFEQAAVDAIFGTSTASLVSFAQSHVQYWENFYTTNGVNGNLNPTAAQIQLAAYGATFGDLVGLGLENPSLNPTVFAIGSPLNPLVQIPNAGGTINWATEVPVNGGIANALIDNAEGTYVSGVTLSNEPAHFLLQGEAASYAQFSNAQVAPVTINNAPTTFTLDTQHYGHAFTGGDVINGGGIGSTFTLILGDSTANDDFGNVAVKGYQTVDIVANGPSAAPGTDILQNLGYPAINANTFSSSFDETVNISGNANLDTSALLLSATGFGIVGKTYVPGATVINDTDTGVFNLLGLSDGKLVSYCTDAQTIDASQSGGLIMFGTDESIGVSITGSATAHNVIIGSVGNDVLTGGVGGDSIFGDGGADTINLGYEHFGKVAFLQAADQVHFGGLNAGMEVAADSITGAQDSTVQGFWGGQPGATDVNIFGGLLSLAGTYLFSGAPGTTGGVSTDMSTIKNFDPGTSSVADQLVFHVSDWGTGTNIAGGINMGIGNASLAPPAFGDAVLGSAGHITNQTDVITLSGSYVNAAQMAAALQSQGLSLLLPANANEHILVAYNSSTDGYATIADVDLFNAHNETQITTSTLNVYASDMVHLVGVTVNQLTGHNIQFAA